MERLRKESLQAFCAMISELQLCNYSWPHIVPIILKVLNHNISPQHKAIGPVTAFTRNSPYTLITAFMCFD